MLAMLGFIELFFILPIVLLGILSSIFWLWMLIDAAVNESSTGTDKVVWVLIILFTHFIGALIYFIVRRSRRTSIL